MPEFARLNGATDWIDLEFVEREATPRSAMKFGIRLHVTGLSLSDTVSVLDAPGVDRQRTTDHNRVQKADQQSAEGRSPNQVAVDETVIWFNAQLFWLVAAVDPETGEFLRFQLYPVWTMALTECFLCGLSKNTSSKTLAIFLVDGAQWLHGTLHRLGLHFRHVTYGNRNAVERVIKGVKAEPTSSLAFSAMPRTEPSKIGSESFAFVWNQLL